LNQQAYRRLISGQSRGIIAAVCRLSLAFLSVLYSIVVRLRNLLYSTGILKSYAVKAIVISVGNITTGGTGKTPLVIWLTKLITQKNVRCAILTRGYKTSTKKLRDEPAILTKNCPDAQVFVNPDRLEAARRAVEKFNAQVLVMDDGFQHRRLRRDLDIVTIDATCPFGYGKILPAGLLREQPSALRRAQAAVITRVDQVEPARLRQIENELRSINPRLILARSIHSPVCARGLQGVQIPLSQLRDKRIFAFCGIGNPEAFFRTLEDLGLNLLDSKAFNDHQNYNQRCLNDIYEYARYLDAELILTTDKDWTKIAPASRAREIPLMYLVVELKLVEGADRLIKLIEETVAGKIQRNEEKGE